MSSQGSAHEAAAAAAPSRPHHQASFKLRFAERRELGRSYMSLVKPLGLPATVADKFYASSRGAAVEERRAAAALRRIDELFARGPADKYDSPLTSAHEYGWWWRAAAADFADRRLHHHIRDSRWLKDRLRVLAADAKLKQR